MSTIQVQVVDRVTPELVEAIGSLTAQLSSIAAAPTSWARSSPLRRRRYS
jgi:hypothetical protein